MRKLGFWLVLLSAGALAAQDQFPSSAKAPAASAAAPSCRCSDRENTQQQESAGLERAIAGLRARLTMLRNDAGIVSDPQIRDALQVDAEMWSSLIELLQQQHAPSQKSRNQPPAGP